MSHATHITSCGTHLMSHGTYIMLCGTHKMSLGTHITFCGCLMMLCGINITLHGIYITWHHIMWYSVKSENEKVLKEKMEGFSKLEDLIILEEEHGTKDYIKNLSVHEARNMFKHRCKMSRYVKMNYKNDYMYSKKLWKCDECQKMDTEKHILWCNGYSHIRENKF